MGATIKASELIFDVSVNDRILDVQLFDLGSGNPPENASIKAMSVVSTPGPLRRLNIALDPNGLVSIWWLSSLHGTLQSADDATGPFDNANLEVQQVGEFNRVEFLPANSRQFYRLQVPAP